MGLRVPKATEERGSWNRALKWRNRRRYLESTEDEHLRQALREGVLAAGEGAFGTWLVVEQARETGKVGKRANRPQAQEVATHVFSRLQSLI